LPPPQVSRILSRCGNLSANPFDQDSTSNQFGRYGSPFSPDSPNNPYGKG
jgi:hypothetical protein